jgi:hypothetical protein
MERIQLGLEVLIVISQHFESTRQSSYGSAFYCSESREHTVSFVGQ